MRAVFNAKTLAVSSFLVASLVILPACGKKPAPAAPPPPSVTVQTPEEQDVHAYSEFTGMIEATQHVEITARVNGPLEKIHFKEGAEVAKGDLLYSIDPREYQAALQTAEASLEQAQAKKLLAESDVTRATRLLNETAISAQELEQDRTTLRESQALVRSGEAAIARARLNLEFTEIRAPISGKISRTRINEGNLIQAGDKLNSIVAQDPVYVYFDVPERVLLQWRKLRGDKAGFPVTEVRVGLADEPDYPSVATLDFDDNQISQQTGTLRLRAVLGNPRRSFLSGNFAKVRVTVGEPQKALLIPGRAINTDQGDQFVYVVGADDTAVYRKVQAGQEYGGKRAILSGLEATDRVVVDGIQNIRAGGKVKPESPAPAKPVEETRQAAKSSAS